MTSLILLSFGNTIGTGIFANSGIASKVAGEAVVLSWVISGAVSFLTALVYAEFSSKIRKAGSSFTYAYAITGEFSAWLIAWNMFARYGMTASINARAFSSYLIGMLELFEVKDNMP